MSLNCVQLQYAVGCLLVLGAAVADGHLCMLSPPQRGSMTNINKPASPDCGLTSGPCGDRKAGDSVLSIKGGSKFLVAFQKNLDHFYPSKPGAFNVSVSFDAEQTFSVLQVMPDTTDPSLTLYYKNVTMPTKPLNKSGVLRVQYVTDNPEAPAVFYQCSDVMLY